MKIKTKLLLSYAAIAFAATLLVSVPVVRTQIAQLEKDIEINAGTMLDAGKKSIQTFFATPATIVKAMGPYTLSPAFNQEDAQRDFEIVVKDYPSLSCLYWTDSVAISDGGKFYSSDGWIPDPDYNKFGQEMVRHRRKDLRFDYDRALCGRRHRKACQHGRLFGR